MADRKSFLLRIDPDVLDALRRWSDDEMRSLNGHLEYLLRRALREAGRQPNRKRPRNPERSSDEPEEE